MIVKKLHQLFLLAALVVVIGSIIMSPVVVKAAISDYLSDWNLVDSGKHLDVDGDSIYMSHIWKGKNIWNGYKSGVIRKDSAKVIQDVFVKDKDKRDGKAGSLNKDGNLYLNKYYLKNNSSNLRTNTATHELGHALGLGHSVSHNIMAEKQSAQITLGNYDEKCYDAAYKKY